jgi:hypothetical protein
MSNEPTIEQKNEAIALFMGGIAVQFRERYITWGRKETMPVNELKYHSSWDWIHPVWVKFRDLKFTEETPMKLHLNYMARLAQDIAYGTIEEFHHNLHIAIQWYNKQKEAANDTN